MEGKNLWIARDKNGRLFIYRNKPCQDRHGSFFDRWEDCIGIVPSDRFPDVTWDNSPKELLAR